VKKRKAKQGVMLITDRLFGFSEDTPSVVDPNHSVDYSKQKVPPNYKCGKCGATSCKLWRDYQTFLDHQSLMCLNCACREQNKVRTTTEDGRLLYTDKVHYWYRTAIMRPDHWCGYDPKNGPPSDAIETRTERERTDQIGWRVPAVPTEGNDSYWGYTSVPQAGCDWWDRLPTTPFLTVGAMCNLSSL